MWQHSQLDQDHQLDQFTEKECPESTGGDSGFISSGYICSSELSSSSLSNEIYSKAPSCSSSSSDIDFNLSDSLSQLSLKHVASNHDESTIINDSGLICTSNSSDNHDESWRLYYTQNDDGDTILHNAIIQGYFEAIFSLIKIAPHPSLLDILNNDCQTALHLAVITNQAKVAKTLVLAGADISIRNYKGNTALHLACISGSSDCVEALLEALSMSIHNSSLSRTTISQILEQRNYHGETCLHVATIKNHTKLVQRLLNAGSNIEARESLGGRTSLHLALERGHVDLAYYLVHHCKSRTDAVTYSGFAAYEMADSVDDKFARELRTEETFRESSYGVAALSSA